MLPALLLLSVAISTALNLNSTMPSNSTYPPSNFTSNSTADRIVVICPREWFTNESCVLATNETFLEIDFDDETQCTRAHSSLYLCLSHPVSSLAYRDEIEELLDDEDY